MHFSDLKQIFPGSISIVKDLEITNFYTDSRAVSGNSSDVFVALQGPKRDGHDFINDAIRQGVKNFIVEKKVAVESVNTFLVGNSRNAFQEIAKNHRLQYDYPVIGITGSNGKTTVKEWLSTILSQRYHPVKSPKSYNSQIGVPLSILQMKPHHDIGIFEAGISTIGEMKLIADVIKPTLGIFTMLGEAHDDGFISPNEKLEEKLLLFDSAEKIICQMGTPWYPSIESQLGKNRLVTWSLVGEADYDVIWEKGVVKVNNDKYHVQLSDSASLQNVTHAIIAALTLKLTVNEIQEGLNLVKSVPMRLELKEGMNGCYILDDTYNNDLEGLKVAIDYLEAQRQNTKKTLVLSDILHSKKSKESLYSEISTLIEQKHFSRFIGVGPRIKACAHLFNANSSFFETVDDLLEDIPPFNQEMILVKGARNFRLEKLVKRLEEKNHGTVLEVNFEALQHNLSTYRQLIAPKTKIMVMVKANAYGSGLLEVSNFLQHHHVDYLGVAYVNEAITLRQNGITLPLMIMNPHIESFEAFEQYHLEPEIFSFHHLERFLKDVALPTPIHIKIDTGMHRLGFAQEEIPELVKTLRDNKQIKVASIFTHFSASDEAAHDAFTSKQAEIFDDAYDQIATALNYKPIKHACNSAALVRWPNYHYDMVRLGIGLHGFDPTQTLRLRTVSKLRSIVSQIQKVKKGETIGYARKAKAEVDSQIAIIPIGYEDGFSRVFGNGKCFVKIKDKTYPTIGNICMDMAMVDVTDGKVSEGDDVFIFNDIESARKLASIADTIPHEILTNISSRVKRVFISE